MLSAKWKAPAATADAIVIAAYGLNPHTQLLQGSQHDIGVIGFKQAAHHRVAFAKRGQQQRAIGDAFRTRQRNFAFHTGARDQRNGRRIIAHADSSRK